MPLGTEVRSDLKQQLPALALSVFNPANPSAFDDAASCAPDKLHGQWEGALTPNIGIPFAERSDETRESNVAATTWKTVVAAATAHPSGSTPSRTLSTGLPITKNKTRRWDIKVMVGK